MDNEKSNRHLNDEEFHESWQKLSASLEANPGNEALKREGFWLCYFKLKSIQESIKARQEQDRKPSFAQQKQSNWLISRMQAFGPPPPDPKYYGPMMGQLRETGNHYESFVKMVLEYGSSFFSKEDHVPYQGEKFESPSQLVKTTRMLAKAYLVNRRAWNLDLSSVLDLLKYAEENALDRDKIWLEYDHAKCLLAAGKMDEARDRVLLVLRKKSSEGWAWAALAATYRKENPAAAIVCFCKALSFAQDATFTIPQRKGLIPLLLEEGDFQAASMLVKSLAGIYTDKGWNLKSDIQDFMATEWYDASVNTDPLDTYFRDKAKSAESYLYGETTKRFAIVVGVHKSGQGFHSFVSSEEKYAVRKAVMSDKKLPLPGQWVQLSIIESDEEKKEVIAATLSKAQQSDNVSQKTGKMIVHDKGYAFVDGSFIAPHLVKKEWDGKQVVMTQVWDINPNKGENSWKAITVDLATDGEL